MYFFVMNSKLLVLQANLDATKPVVELQKEVKNMETDTKFEDSEDEIDWSQYKSEI